MLLATGLPALCRVIGVSTQHLKQLFGMCPVFSFTDENPERSGDMKKLLKVIPGRIASLLPECAVRFRLPVLHLDLDEPSAVDLSSLPSPHSAVRQVDSSRSILTRS